MITRLKNVFGLHRLFSNLSCRSVGYWLKYVRTGRESSESAPSVHSNQYLVQVIFSCVFVTAFHDVHVPFKLCGTRHCGQHFVQRDDSLGDSTD